MFKNILKHDSNDFRGDTWKKNSFFISSFLDIQIHSDGLNFDFDSKMTWKIFFFHIFVSVLQISSSSHMQ